MDKKYEFLEKMNNLLKESYETKLTENELIFILPNIGLTRSQVKTELAFYDEDCEIEGKSSGIMQIYFTICTYHEEEETQIAVKLLELNEHSLLGNFNLYKPYKHIYYRCSLVIPDLEYEGAPETVLAALAKLSSNLDYLYSYLVMIGDNVSSITLEEYQDEMDNIKKLLEIDPDYLDKMNNGEV